MKRTFYTELAYLFGLAAIALGTTFMEAADFGVSMVVAPAYLLYLKLSEVWSFFTFGMAEYVLQLVLLLLMCAILGRFRLPYLVSFLTAVLYGSMLDGFMALFALVPSDGMGARVVCYVLGLVVCALGVALMFHSSISPEVYELFVKEVSAKFGWQIARFKTVYDCLSCALAVGMSFLFFGELRGVGVGTILCALVNGWMIGQLSRFLEARWQFREGTGLGKYCG